MDIDQTDIPGVKILTPRRFRDDRGFFAEVWNARTLSQAGIDIDFVQDNHSVSVKAGTLRGLHYQAPPHAQAKLVRCGNGSVWDVAVDARRGSPTYGLWTGVELSADNGRQLLIPAGFLHGFVTLTDNAEVVYKCSDFYFATADGSVRWDSAGLAIDWPLNAEPELSEKDAHAVDFGDWESPFEYEG